MLKILSLAIALLASLPVQAAPLPPAARAEVDALLLRLNGCRFNRNGSWHDAAEARTHLLRKLDYLQDRNMVATAEQFIERGASTSSSSGKPYLVQCGQGPAQPSAQWLLSELKAIRSAPAASASAR